MWELLLVPSSEQRQLKGYLYKRSWMGDQLTKSVTDLLDQNYLPLVLDLDDTVIKMVGPELVLTPADHMRCKFFFLSLLSSS